MLNVRDRPAASAEAVPLAGLGFMLLGILVFACSDVVGKWLVASVTVGQMLLVRSLVILVILAPVMSRKGRALVPRTGLAVHLGRGLFSALDVALFYAALALLPLATVMTFYLAGPIYVTALSALLLRERVGAARWLAVFSGFAGVLVALGPEIGNTTIAALIAVLGSVAYALYLVATRFLAGADGATLLIGQTGGTFVLGLALAPFGWGPISAGDLALLVLIGVLSMSAHLCINRSLTLAPASAVVPFQYTLIVWAVLFGYLVFDEVPTTSLLAGAALIVASGLFIFLRESRRRPAET